MVQLTFNEELIHLDWFFKKSKVLTDIKTPEKEHHNTGTFIPLQLKLYKMPVDFMLFNLDMCNRYPFLRYYRKTNKLLTMQPFLLIRPKARIVSIHVLPLNYTTLNDEIKIKIPVKFEKSDFTCLMNSDCFYDDIYQIIKSYREFTFFKLKTFRYLTSKGRLHFEELRKLLTEK